MNRQIKGLLYFQAANAKRGFTIFWSILIGTTILSWLISAFTMSGDNFMSISIAAATYIYGMFIGFNMVRYNVSYTLKLGATRKNIYISTGLFFLGLSLVNAFIVSVIQAGISFLNTTFSVDTYMVMHPALLLSDTWLNRLMIDVSMMFFFLSLLFIFGLLFYRYGLLGGGSVAAIALMLFLVEIGTGRIPDIILDLYESISLLYFSWVLLAGVVVYLLSWLYLRRITIIMKK